MSICLLVNGRESVSKKEEVSLQLSWKNQFQFAGYYMAKEKGFYSDVNLDVEIKEHNGTGVVRDVINKKSTYGIGRSSLIVDIANGKKLYMLSAIFQSSPSIFIALKDSNISTIKDFTGKRIMVTQDMSSGVSLQASLKKNGLDISDMEILKHSYTIESLLNGETDIMASYISNEPYMLSQKKKEIVIFDPANEGFDFYNDILFTSSEELLLHASRVKAFTEASIKGWEYAFSNIDETVEVILQKYNTQKKTKEALTYEANALKKLAYSSGTTFGELQYEKVQRIYDIFNVMGFIKKEVPIHTFFVPVSKKLLTDTEEYYLKEKRNIKICVNPDWMPYEKIKLGRHIGISADYSKVLKRLLNTELTLVKTKNWEESLEFIKDRKCDVLPLTMDIPSIKPYVNFTEPYLDFSLVMATRLEVPFIENYTLLKNKKIGVMKGFAFSKLLQNKYPNLTIVEVDNSTEGLSRVVDKELFGYVGSLVEIGYLFQNRFVGELKVSGQFENKLPLFAAVRSDDVILLNILNKAFKSVSDVQKQEIQNRWVSIHYDEREDYTLFWWLFGLLLFGLGISLILYMRQKEITKIMQEQAVRDPMTQLHNRRHFTTTSEKIFSLALRNKTETSIIMIDVDDFKDVNDTYGHKAGDNTLLMIANVMKKRSRKSDILARWGGEEFLMLLPETDIQGANEIAEKLRKSIEELSIESTSNKELKVTISVGISKVFIEKDINLEAAISRADSALYKAKTSGKNRVCINVDEF